MNGVTDNLMALQLLQLKKSASNQQVAALRAQIPESYLQTFDRLLSRKKRPVSVVHHGVCSECHLCIPVGTVGTLANGSVVQTCGNCGRFLYLPPEESLLHAHPTNQPPAKPAAKKRPEIAHAHAV